MKLSAILLVLLGCVCAAFAGEPASIPYEKLHALFQDAAGIVGPHLHASIAINSTNKEVRPEQIAFVIQAKSGPIKLAVQPNGELRDFPLNPELETENPPIVANQPKGTLRITNALELQLPESASYTAAQLNDLIQEANIAIKEQAGAFSEIAPQGIGLIFAFPAGKNPGITVASKSDRKTLRPNADGKIILPLDAQTVADNPTITPSEKPTRVTVDFPKK